LKVIINNDTDDELELSKINEGLALIGVTNLELELNNNNSVITGNILEHVVDYTILTCALVNATLAVLSFCKKGNQNSTTDSPAKQTAKELLLSKIDEAGMSSNIEVLDCCINNGIAQTTYIDEQGRRYIFTGQLNGNAYEIKLQDD
jgi:large-conductance mechanosensitive channel